MDKTIFIPARLKSGVVDGHVAGAADIIDDAKGITQDVINRETDASIEGIEQSIEDMGKQIQQDSEEINAKIEQNKQDADKEIASIKDELATKQDNLTFDDVPTEDSTNPVISGGVKTAIDNESGRAAEAERTLGNAIEEETTERKDAVANLQQDIDSLSDAVDANKTASEDRDKEIQGQVDSLRDDSTTLSATIDAEKKRAMAAEDKNREDIDNINSKIPTEASTENLLADKAFVNSSVATNTAYYISDNGEPFESLDKLNAYTGKLTNNDYAFVKGVDESGNILFNRYKYNSVTKSWSLEYTLNNSSFTQSQWGAISSGITALLTNKLAELPSLDELKVILLLKQDVIDDLETIRANAQKGSGAYHKPLAGIPSEDMSQEIQQSLSKADTALQEHQDISGKADKATSLEGYGIEDAYNKDTVDAKLLQKQDSISDLQEIREGAAKGATALQEHQSLNDYYNKSKIDELLGEKQDNITIDSIPTADSSNPVSSEAVYDLQRVLVAALNNKQDSLTFDLSPTEGSGNPVTSGGVYNAIAEVGYIKFLEVSVLPQADAATKNTIYIVRQDESYMWYASSIDTSLDPPQYVWRLVNTVNFSRYATINQIVAAINDSLIPYSTTEHMNEAITTSLSDYYTKTETAAILEQKQDNLEFDAVPTEGSQNPVTSGGVKTAIEAMGGTKQDVLTFDATPTSDSQNPVTSEGIKNAIADFITSSVSNLTNYYLKSETDTELGKKQDTISDLSAIRSGASAGASAYQKPTAGIPKSDLDSDIQASLTKADTALQSHQDISGKADRATTLAGYDISDAYTKTEVNEAIQTSEANSQKAFTAALAEKAEASSVYTKTEVGSTFLTKTDASNTYATISSLSSYVNTASYDSQGKKILLKHGTTTLAEIDAAPFIKDGMVSGVSVTDGNLTVIFNTDAGKSDISIPINEIFDASNYYTKSEIDSLLSGSGSGVVVVTSETLSSYLTDYAKKSNLATVATSGSYKDLSDKPTIPSLSGYATESWVTNKGYTTNTGTITKVGNTSSGAVTVSSSNNTASFGSAVTVGSVGGVDLKFTMPSNPNTNTWKAANASQEGYVPKSTANKILRADGNGVLYWGDDVDTNTHLITSVVGKTGAVTAAQIGDALTSAGYKLTDTNTDTNTTYTLSTGDSNGQIKVTPSSGSAYNVSVKGLGSNAYNSTTIPTKTSQLTNDSGFLTSHQSLTNYVTTNSEQTISEKKIFSKGICITYAAVNKSMPYFLGIDAFADGGAVKYIAAGDVAAAIGALKAVTAQTGGPTANATLTFGGTFTVPYISQATNGQVTVTNRTMTMPANPNTDTKYSASTGLTLSGTAFSVNYGSAAGTACQGNDSRLSDARVASNMTFSYSAVSSNQSPTCSLSVDGVQNIVFYNSGSSSITIAPGGTVIDGNTSISLDAGAYCEVSFLKIGSAVYTRSAS